MDGLAALGFDARLSGALAALGRAELVPARIVRLERGFASALGAAGSSLVRLPVGMDASAVGVGDWLALAPGDPPELAALLPRTSALVRKAAGEAAVEQILAANVDTVLVMMGLDGDVSARRLERWLAMVHAGGAAAALILNKADLCDAAPLLPELEPIVTPRAVPVHVISAATGAGVEALAPYLAPGRTVAFVGSSGVGKSTLLNRLLQRDAQRTADVRRRDRRGKHTTTFRELFVLPGGAAVIDTPGVRELALWGDATLLAEAFADVAALAAECRFDDCRHEAEPGCAVRAAIDTGALEPARLASFRDLEKELAELEADRAERSRRRSSRPPRRR